VGEEEELEEKEGGYRNREKDLKGWSKVERRRGWSRKGEEEGGMFL